MLGIAALGSTRTSRSGVAELGGLPVRTALRYHVARGDI